MRSEPASAPPEPSALVSRFGPDLLRYAESLCRHREIAEEAVQETFIRLLKQPSLAEADHIKAWMFCVCRSRVRDLCRKENRMKPLEPETLANHPDERPDPARHAELHDELGRVDQLLSKLPENQREVVRLKYQGGLSYREISDVTHLSVSHVGVLLHTALTTLRGQLQTHEA